MLPYLSNMLTALTQNPQAALTTKSNMPTGFEHIFSKFAIADSQAEPITGVEIIKDAVPQDAPESPDVTGFEDELVSAPGDGIAVTVTPPNVREIKSHPLTTTDVQTTPKPQLTSIASLPVPQFATIGPVPDTATAPGTPVEHLGQTARAPHVPNAPDHLSPAVHVAINGPVLGPIAATTPRPVESMVIPAVLGGPVHIPQDTVVTKTIRPIEPAPRDPQMTAGAMMRSEPVKNPPIVTQYPIPNVSQGRAERFVAPERAAAPNLAVPQRAVNMIPTASPDTVNYLDVTQTVSDATLVRPMTGHAPNVDKATVQIDAPNIIRQLTQSLPVTTPKQPVQYEIELNPKELGHVKISIRPNETSISVHVACDADSTAQLVRRNIDLLTRDLTALGYANVDVDLNQSPHQKTPQPWTILPQGPTEEQSLHSEPEASITHKKIRSNHAIDIRI